MKRKEERGGGLVGAVLGAIALAVVLAQCTAADEHEEHDEEQVEYCEEQAGWVRRRYGDNRLGEWVLEHHRNAGECEDYL